MENILDGSKNFKVNRRILAIFLFLASYIVFISFYSNKTVSAARAYIAGEGQWTKAQKRATIELIKYTLTRDEQAYEAFQDNLNVIEGDRMARETLSSNQPNLEIAAEGLIQGNNHPNDIDKMIWMFRRFKNFSYMKEAIDIWGQADLKIDELKSLAAQIKQSPEDGTQPQTAAFIKEISVIDEELTRLEKAFSEKMGQAARWVNNFVFWSTIISGSFFLIIAYTVTRAHIRKVNTIYRQLSVSEKKFRNVLRHSQDVIYQLDLETSRYAYMSPHIKDLLGFTDKEILEKGPEFILNRIHPDDKKNMVNDLELIEQGKIQSDFSEKTEYRIQKKNGEYIWISNIKELAQDENGKPYAIVGNVRDISEEKRKAFQLQQSLKEKRTLLEEIHHRVKNNLAIVSSLIELQKPDLDDKTEVMLTEIQSRIQSIAMIHEKLYKSDTLSNINVQEYVNDLIDSVSRAYKSKYKKIEITRDIDPITLNINEGISLGLLINELLNNAYKHAFSDADEGEIKTILKNNGDHAKLVIADNGKGLPEDFSLEGGQSLGITLIDTLSQTLQSQIEFKSGKWTEFSLTFPLEESV